MAGSGFLWAGQRHSKSQYPGHLHLFLTWVTCQSKGASWYFHSESAAFGSREKVLPVFIEGKTSWLYQEAHGRNTWGKAEILMNSPSTGLHIPLSRSRIEGYLILQVLEDREELCWKRLVALNPWGSDRASTWDRALRKELAGCWWVHPNSQQWELLCLPPLTGFLKCQHTRQLIPVNEATMSHMQAHHHHHHPLT